MCSFEVGVYDTVVQLNPAYAVNLNSNIDLSIDSSARVLQRKGLGFQLISMY